MGEKTIWGVHMDWSLELEPIEQGYIAIGWDKLGDLSKIAPTREAIKVAIAIAYPDKKPGAIPVDAGTLFRFTHEMTQGDFVVYPPALIKSSSQPPDVTPILLRGSEHRIDVVQVR
jgi:restriction system protein